MEDNPLAYELLDILDRCNTQYLLPRRKKFSREIIPDQHTSRSNVYRKIREIDPSLWVHGLRGLRASHLVAERGFDVFNLTKWFNWSDTKVPTTYVQLDVEDLKDRIRRAKVRESDVFENNLRTTTEHGV